MSDTQSDGGDCTEHRTAVTEAEVEALVRGICLRPDRPASSVSSWSGSSTRWSCRSSRSHPNDSQRPTPPCGPSL